MPLVYFFYHGLMGAADSNAHIVMTKQGVNGVANALVARLTLTSIAAKRRSSLTRYRELVHNLPALFALCLTGMGNNKAMKSTAEPAAQTSFHPVTIDRETFR